MLRTIKTLFRRRRTPANQKFHVGEFCFGDQRVHAVFRSGTLDESIFRTVYEEYGLASLVRSLAGRKATAVDIGGHIGSFSVIMASLLPELESHVYEYLPENFRLIQANIALNGLERRVRASNRAVSDRSDGFVPSITLGAADTNTGGVCVAHPSQVSNHTDGNSVPTIASSDLFATVEHVDVLKIDCEGSEFKILFSLDEKAFRKIDRITGEIHDNRAFHGFDTKGHAWKPADLLSYLGRFYRTVTVHQTNQVDWGFLQIFTAANPR